MGQENLSTPKTVQKRLLHPPYSFLVPSYLTRSYFHFALLRAHVVPPPYCCYNISATHLDVARLVQHVWDNSCLPVRLMRGCGNGCPGESNKSTARRKGRPK